ncbi:MAG: PilZ domain-containing protein [Acidobacteria bacterium]|nr:PilZ domain-containing protein [Acidobacteriota bacterium]
MDTERRTYERYRSPLQLVISASSGSEQTFMEQTSTLNISSTGAYFYLYRPLDKDSLVSLLLGGERVTARVVRVEQGSTGSTFGIGVKFLEPLEKSRTSSFLFASPSA